MKIIVYTAIFGSIPDFLHRPSNVPDNVELHAYVDNIYGPEKHPSGWDLMPAIWEHKTNSRLRARRHKLLSHVLYPNADYTLWVDGCLTPTVDPTQLIDTYLQQNDICLFKHMQRSCVYEEFAACLKMRKDTRKILDAVRNRYWIEQYPANRGLAETTALLRRNTPMVAAMNDLWWQELKNNSIRDQLSFNYVTWKLHMEYSTFAGTRADSPYFEWRAHR